MRKVMGYILLAVCVASVSMVFGWTTFMIDDGINIWLHGTESKGWSLTMDVLTPVQELQSTAVYTFGLITLILSATLSGRQAIRILVGCDDDHKDCL